MKVGMSQATKPAPIWFRRVRDACVRFLLPGLGQLVTSIGLTPKDANMWLQVITFIPLAFDAIGVLLGEDVKKKVRVWLIFILCSAALLSGCRSHAELAAAKTRQQAIKDSVAREQRMQLYQQVRVALPCVPDTIIRGITVYLSGDSIPCPPGGKCPPQGVRVDTMKVRDEIALVAVRDSLVHAQYLNGLKDAHILTLQANYDKQLQRANKEAETASLWRRIVLWAAGIIAAGFTIWLLVGGKLKFISKLFSWLISILR